MCYTQLVMRLKRLVCTQQVLPLEPHRAALFTHTDLKQQGKLMIEGVCKTHRVVCHLDETPPQSTAFNGIDIQASVQFLPCLLRHRMCSDSGICYGALLKNDCMTDILATTLTSCLLTQNVSSSAHGKAMPQALKLHQFMT